MAYDLLSPTPGQRALLLGNEAIVRGALEAGIDFISCYPGTPSSEVPDTFFRLSAKGPYYFEYSVNEKVALEVGGGAALAGAMTLVTMKHVGVNVAADPLMTLAYMGAPGGLVLLSADDPGCHSSQDEQDNRIFCRLAGMPCFEPATAQEAKDMTRDALLLAREWETPVMLRTTTRVNHLRGPVESGALPEPKAKKEFEKNPRRFVPIPAFARLMHTALLERLEKVRAIAETSPWNKETGQGKVGVLSAGICRTYVRDCVEDPAVPAWKDKTRVFELGLSYPLPEERLAAFLRSVDCALVVEELEPVLETELRALANCLGIATPIYGKLSMGQNTDAAAIAAHLPRTGEYSTVNVRRALHRLLEGQELDLCCACDAVGPLPLRPPNLCAGCSHRALYYAVRRVFGDEAAYSSDIGCYTLGILPPLAAADFLLCMGSSVSTGSGVARVSGKRVVAFIGDSTFFHSGITGLVNAVFNKHDLLLVILDNATTAMTGHQPNPGVELTAFGPNETRVDIQTVVRGCGVEQVRKVSPYNLKATIKTLEEMKLMSGVRVLIAEEPCVLYARRALKKAPGQVAYVAEQCDEVVKCLETLACPAFYRQGEEIAVDAGSCSGCMVCLQITSKIKARKRSR